MVLLGIGPEDTEAEAVRLADKVCGVRVFEDDAGKMNLNLDAVGGALLVVSQFTLYADLNILKNTFIDKFLLVSIPVNQFLEITFKIAISSIRFSNIIYLFYHFLNF